MSNVDNHVTLVTPARYPTNETAIKPTNVMPEANPSNPSIRFIALAIPTIHKQDKPNANHCGKETVPNPTNWTVVKFKSAPQTTKPAIKNSPESFILGDNRAKSSKKPITNIPIEPNNRVPISALSPINILFNCGTVREATETTTMNDKRIAAPPNLGVACW